MKKILLALVATIAFAFPAWAETTGEDTPCQNERAGPSMAAKCVWTMDHPELRHGGEVAQVRAVTMGDEEVRFMFTHVNGYTHTPMAEIHPLPTAFPDLNEGDKVIFYRDEWIAVVFNSDGTATHADLISRLAETSCQLYNYPHYRWVLLESPDQATLVPAEGVREQQLGLHHLSILDWRLFQVWEASTGIALLDDYIKSKLPEVRVALAQGKSLHMVIPELAAFPDLMDPANTSAAATLTRSQLNAAKQAAEELGHGTWFTNVTTALSVGRFANHFAILQEAKWQLQHAYLKGVAEQVRAALANGPLGFNEELDAFVPLSNLCAGSAQGQMKVETLH